MKHSQKMSTQRIALCGMLLAVMLVLGWVESLLPAVTAIPGVKLGLSNGVLIFAVYMLDIPASVMLMVLKVALSGMLFGNPSTMMYALAGGALSLLCMVLLSRCPQLHPVVVSGIGGAMHNVGQVALALLILRTPSLFYYMGVLVLAGLGCGILTGICARLVMKHLKGFKSN